MSIPTPRRTGAALGALLALLAACNDESDTRAAASAGASGALQDGPAPGSSSPSGSEAPSSASEPAVCDQLLNATGLPLVTAAFAISDACPSQRRGAVPAASSTSTELGIDEPGAVCLRGELSDGWVSLIISFDHINDMPTPAVHGPLSAAALGIAELAFTLDTPPASGLTLALSQVVRDGCPASSDQCIDGSFLLLDEQGSAPLELDAAGDYSFPFVRFRQLPARTANLDTTRLAGLELRLAQQAGSFDFCVRDFTLLDGAGDPVTGAD